MNKNEPFKPWQDSAIREFEEDSFHLFLVFLGFGTWLSCFRVIITGSTVFLCETLELLFLFSFVMLIKNRNVLIAKWIYVLGILAVLTTEIYALPISGIQLFFFIPICIAGIILGEMQILLTGFLSISDLLILQSYHPLGFDLILLIAFLLLITGLTWFSRRQTRINIKRTASYAYQARSALETSRDMQAQLARAVKSLDESNYRLTKAYRLIAANQNEIETAQQEKTQFTNTISHEMRAPLNFIIGATDLMAKNPLAYGKQNWPEGLGKDIEQVNNCAQFLSTLINDVLTLGQLDGDIVDFNYDPCSIKDVIEEVVNIVSPVFKHNGLSIKVNCDSDIPRIRIDKNRIRQVMMNLLSNSYRYTQKGGVKIQAVVDRNNILVSVEDTGRGIPADEIPKLFQEFSQISVFNSVKHDLPSSGLGLSISKKFINLQGGEIWAESPILDPINGEGPGTRISFRLPLHHSEMIQTIRVGHLPAETIKINKSEKNEKNVLIYSSSSDQINKKLPFVLSGYRLSFIRSFENIETTIRESNTCALIYVGNAVDQEEYIPRLSIPIIRCYIEASKLHIQRNWIGYLTKPTSPEQIYEALNQLNPKVKTCLVIDDDPNVSRLVQLSTLSYGLTIEINSRLTGLEGYEFLKNNETDVVLVDLNLPDISGWKLLEKLREDEKLKEIPVIIFSAIEEPQQIEMTLKSLDIEFSQRLNSFRINNLLQSILDTAQITG